MSSVNGETTMIVTEARKKSYSKFDSVKPGGRKLKGKIVKNVHLSRRTMIIKNLRLKRYKNVYVTFLKCKSQRIYYERINNFLRNLHYRVPSFKIDYKKYIANINLKFSFIFIDRQRHRSIIECENINLCTIPYFNYKSSQHIFTMTTFKPQDRGIHNIDIGLRCRNNQNTLCHFKSINVDNTINNNNINIQSDKHIQEMIVKLMNKKFFEKEKMRHTIANKTYANNILIQDQVKEFLNKLINEPSEIYPNNDLIINQERKLLYELTKYVSVNDQNSNHSYLDRGNKLGIIKIIPDNEDNLMKFLKKYVSKIFDTHYCYQRNNEASYRNKFNRYCYNITLNELTGFQIENYKNSDTSKIEYKITTYMWIVITIHNEQSASPKKLELTSMYNADIDLNQYTKVDNPLLCSESELLKFKI